MRKMFFVTIILMIVLNIYSIVEFEQIFEFQNPDYAPINNLWINDYDGDESDDFYIFSNYDSNNHLYIYNQNGDVLNNFSFFVPDTLTLDFCQTFKHENLEYFVQIFNYIQIEPGEIYGTRNLIMTISSWPDLSLIDSIIVEIGEYQEPGSGGGVYNSYSFRTSSMKYNYYDDVFSIFLNVSVKRYHCLVGEYETNSSQSRLHWFAFENSALSFLENLDNCGVYHLQNDRILSLGGISSYTSDMMGYSYYKSYYFNELTGSNPFNVNEIFNIEGGQHLLFHQLYLSDRIFQFHFNPEEHLFNCYDLNSLEIIWETMSSDLLNMGYEIKRSISISTNEGDDYILTFGENESNETYALEIRNSMNGIIEEYQESPICPRRIYLVDNEKPIFFQELNSGYLQSYVVYTIEGTIQLDSFNSEIPLNKIILSNYPNPFNPSTTIDFSIQNDSNVELSIYNTKGQKIKMLTHNEYPKGSHSIVWNGDDKLGNFIGSGIYYYKLKVNGKTEAVKKCLLLK